MEKEMASEDTQAVLLLCGTLGARNGVKPLTPAQYNGLASGLANLGKRPRDLLHDAELGAAACGAQEKNARLREPATPERVRELLGRGVTLSLALNKWAGYGIRPISRADGIYPRRISEHLSMRAAPPVIYFAGNSELLAGGGMAVVGSRNLGEEAAAAIGKVVADCVGAGMPIVSGGARGADQTAMRAAYERGGKVIGALLGDLCKACVDPANREALAGGNALLFSSVDPEAGFSTYAAMERNRYIYAMADAAFVAQSGSGTRSGTWSGASEELKRKGARPVFVHLGEEPSEGCLDLQKRGALEWDLGKSAGENMKRANATRGEALVQGDLFEG